MSSHSFSATGIVLKRSDVGEQDRIITLFTKERGKLVAIAKGCRKITSSRLSSLEPGNECSLYLVPTHSLPILTQVKLLHDFSGHTQTLPSMRKLFEILEIIDTLVVEDDEQPRVYQHTKNMLEHLHDDSTHATGNVRTSLSMILEILGFARQDEIDQSVPLRDLVEQIAQRKMKAFNYLTLH